MDAAARAELDALRRRAFGPQADIHDDPAALARLIELEDVARPPLRPEPVPDAPALPASPEEPSAGTTVVTGDVTLAPASQWRRRIIGAVAAAAVVISSLVLAQPLAEPMRRAPAALSAYVSPFTLIAEPRSKTLMTIRSDASFGGYIQLPTEKPTPRFPTSETLAWAIFMGEYYGWELWIAGGSGAATDDHCMVIRRDDDVRGRCANAAQQRANALRISISAADIPISELPEPMTARDRIRFQWIESGAIEIVMGMFGTG